MNRQYCYFSFKIKAAIWNVLNETVPTVLIIMLHITYDNKTDVAIQIFDFSMGSLSGFQTCQPNCDLRLYGLTGF